MVRSNLDEGERHIEWVNGSKKWLCASAIRYSVGVKLKKR